MNCIILFTNLINRVFRKAQENQFKKTQFFIKKRTSLKKLFFSDKN